MLELLSSGLLGSIFGGLFRLAPELIKLFDRKFERMHEYKMFMLQTDLEKLRGEFRMESRYVDHSISQLDAISEAFKEQSKTASSSYKWVAAASAMVRPSVTYFLFLMYAFFKFIMIYLGWYNDIDWMTIIDKNWTQDDFAMLNMILTFWFVGRAIEKYRKNE
jgi:hypothetical protein